MTSARSTSRSQRPLAGVRVVVPRAGHQAGELAALLQDAGATAIELPAIRVEFVTPSADGIALVNTLRPGDWVAFSSANAAAALAATLGLSPCPQARIASIGPATTRALADIGWHPVLEATESTGAGLALSLCAAGIDGQTVLLPRSDIADEALPKALRAAGARVHELVVYRTLPEPGVRLRFANLLAARGTDALCVTSGSVVSALLGELDAAARHELSSVAIVSIGPRSSERCRELGIAVAAEAQSHSARGIMVALMSHFESRSRGQGEEDGTTEERA